MNLSVRIKPISYLKAHAAEVFRTLGEEGGPLVAAQNGEARAVVQSISDYEKTQETLALLKILALGSRQIEEGRTKPASEVSKGGERFLRALAHAHRSLCNLISISFSTASLTLRRAASRFSCAWNALSIAPTSADLPLGIAVSTLRIQCHMQRCHAASG